jgi:tRNA nucleotidyltransferase (CCA-adding enzyme)
MLSWYDLLFTERRYEKWSVYFLALCDALSEDAFRETCERLAVNEHMRHTLHDARRVGAHALEAMENASRRHLTVRHSDIHGWLRDLPVEAILYLMAHTRNESARKYISLYVTTLQEVHSLISGDDLLAMGIPPGPRFRAIFDTLLAERLNGEFVSREDELRRAREIAGRFH